MKKSDTILLAIIILATCLSLAFSFYKTVLISDFDIVNVEPAEEVVQ